MRTAIFPVTIFALALIPLQLAVAGSPEELVVSGYRPVAAQELGTSITLLDAETIDNATITSFEQLVQLVPNMNLSGEASRARYFQLRGVGEREQYEGAPNPSVGFIVDDIDLSGIGGITSTFDMSQLEVLRGPQSARYGSSALAGIVYVQTALPTEELSARAELTGGTDDTRIIGLALGGGISDNVQGRFSVHSYRDNGFRRNDFLRRDDTNERDETTVRGKLRWNMGRDWEALLTGLYVDADNGYDAFALDNSDITFSDEPGRDTQTTQAASLRIGGPLNNAVELVSISTASTSDIFFSFDSDWVNESFFLPIVYDYRYRNPRERDNLSQEFRLVSRPDGRLFNGSTDWVAGVYSARLDEKNAVDSTGDYVETAVGCVPGICFADRQIGSSFRAATLAVFGGLDAALSDRLKLSVGLRVERWDARYRDNWSDNATFPVTRVTNAFDPDETLIGGHVALSFDWTDAARPYVRLARGFKAGGFNPSLTALGGPAENVAYDSEALWNLEAGLKGQGFGGDLRYDLAVFGMRRDDAQLSQSNQFDPGDPNTFVFTTDNGEARVYGAEVSLAWQLSAALELHGTLGLLDTEITEWSINPLVEGRALAHAPGSTLNFGATWSGIDGMFLRIDLNRVADFYFDISHNEKSDAYSTVNVRAGKAWESWSVSLWTRNLFDEQYATRGFFFGNEPPSFAPTRYTKFGDPRQLGITLQYRY